MAGSELIAGVLRAKAVLVGFHARVMIRRMLQVAMASMPTGRAAACASSL